MGDLEQYQQGMNLLPRDARRSVQAISRTRRCSLVRRTAIDADADVALAKVDAITDVTGAAMSSVVRVAKAQRHLELLAPEAVGRLAYLADDHMLSMGDTMADLRRDLRRR